MKKTIDSEGLFTVACLWAAFAIVSVTLFVNIFYYCSEDFRLSFSLAFGGGLAISFIIGTTGDDREIDIESVLAISIMSFIPLFGASILYFPLHHSLATGVIVGIVAAVSYTLIVFSRSKFVPK